MTEYNKDRALIDELIHWIEEHLDTAPRIETVSQKSGYSKWHLQRKFTALTGMNIATYMRNRRLSKAAIALKTSDDSIIDIATHYSFDSQQTFTRTFKKRFGITPHQYRISDDWHVDLLTPHFRFEEPFTLNIECINVPSLQLKRLRDDVTLFDRRSAPESKSHFLAMRDQLMCDAFRRAPVRSSPIFSIMSGKNEAQEGKSVRYTLAESASGSTHDTQRVIVDGGCFMSIKFSGTMMETHQLTSFLFDNVLPELRKKVGASHEIEQIQLDPAAHNGKWGQSQVDYHYMLSLN
ncbi:MAG: helix-turn-helix domain-containing protein [Yersiniaceae bacterium]|nr:helix-turn-helix domain-containing protein [Chimaeribacter coloradensis]MDU6411402.1 helix-turn-helix domain-containing protein [Yersiniaceae bacterium]